MIIARICGPKGSLIFHGSVEILGAPAEDDYRMGGWFPVESFSFGLDGGKSEEDKPDPSKSTTKNNTGRPGSNAPPDKKADKKESSEMQIEKVVDMATTHLMQLAMKERSKKKGAEQDIELHADIHVLGSVAFKDTADRNIFPSVIIHMEGVHVTKWSIKGSGEGRPTESVTLLYDKVAMQYTWTRDGRYLEPLTQAGWDQTKNEKWGDKPGDINPPFSKYVPTF